MEPSDFVQACNGIALPLRFKFCEWQRNLKNCVRERRVKTTFVLVTSPRHVSSFIYYTRLKEMKKKLAPHAVESAASHIRTPKRVRAVKVGGGDESK